MKRYLIGLLIFSIAIMIFLASEVASLKGRIRKSEFKSEQLERRNDSLQVRMNEMARRHPNMPEIPRQESLNKLLDDYFKDKGEAPLKPEITTQELRSELHQLEMKKRMVPDMNPIRGEYVISRKFGKDHRAVDFAAAMGTEVVATGAGVIKSVYEDQYFGNVLIIDHLNDYITMYAHLNRTFFPSRTFVEKGETIAYVGNTGNSTDPHLHYEILYKGENIDPLTMIEKKEIKGQSYGKESQDRALDHDR